MISSKKITLIGVLLAAAALAFTIALMLIPSEALTGNPVGDRVYSEEHTVSYQEDDYYSTYSEGAITKITLSGSTAEAGSKNVSVDGGTVTILGGGTYVISGELTDGSIIVNSADGGKVTLVLNSVSVTSSDFAALYVKQSGKTIISLVKGTENHFTDGAEYNKEKAEGDNISAAIYSKDDLTVNGEGSLTVNGNYLDGIKVNDGFKITGGTLKVTAVDDGINVNDYAAALKASVEVNSGGDGIKCEHEKNDKGFIAFEGTSLNIVSGGDGVYASSSVYMNDVTARITAGGGSSDAVISRGKAGRGGFGFPMQSSENDVSTKALKAGAKLQITGGTFTLDSLDDAIHSDGSVSVNGGSFTVQTGDDAVHGEMKVYLNPDTLEITKCREGIEGAYVVIDGGSISIISDDDGINATGENSSGGFGGPMGGRKENITTEDIYLTVNGGNIYIETSGDGVDSNGAAVINGGTVMVYGPEDNGNSSLDFEYGFVINGGVVLAAGSSGMAELPSDSSAQRSVVFYLDKSYDGGSEILISDSDEVEIASGVSNKKFNWVCVSTADLAEGKTYTLSINGAEISSAEVTDIVTSVGNSGRRW